MPLSDEIRRTRKVRFSVAAAVAVVLCHGTSEAQPLAAIKLFNATPTTESAPCVDPNNCSPIVDRVVFDEATLMLSCKVHPTALLSSTADGRGSLLVDNFLEVNGKNVCRGGVIQNGVEMCFTAPYAPVTPLDISRQMPRRGAVTFDLVDFGGVYSNTDIWLVTDCRMMQKAGICHKPGTPAEKVLYVGLPAIAGHLRHGDTLDLSACRR